MLIPCRREPCQAFSFRDYADSCYQCCNLCNCGQLRGYDQSVCIRPGLQALRIVVTAMLQRMNDEHTMGTMLFPCASILLVEGSCYTPNYLLVYQPWVARAASQTLFNPIFTGEVSFCIIAPGCIMCTGVYRYPSRSICIFHALRVARSSWHRTQIQAFSAIQLSVFVDSLERFLFGITGVRQQYTETLLEAKAIQAQVKNLYNISRFGIEHIDQSRAR